MKIFPAIDIKDKKCVRLVKGNFDNKTEYKMSPVEQAGEYKDHGFKNLHIVDLDGALAGEIVNLDIIQDIVSRFNPKVEVGGGIRNLDSIQKYIDVGVEKVILGSAAIKDKNFLKKVCEKFPNKIALGLDAKGGYLSVSGWKENSNQLTLDYLKEVNDFGISRLIYTDINRDGMKQSPNFEETSTVAGVARCPVIISGGVSSIDDIKKAKELNNQKAMMLGTAGFTALLCSFAVKAKEELLLGEKVKDVLVTGATGGVGSIAVMILSKMGYDVHAVTGKKDKEDYLKNLGAKYIIDRKEFEGESKLLEKGIWDGVVDTVGGASLTKIFAQTKPGGIVAACGNAGGIKINTTVMPFIIRGVKLWGIDSSGSSIKRREFVWNEAAKLIDFSKLKSFTKELSFTELLETYPKLLKGEYFGRAIVNPNK